MRFAFLNTRGWNEGKWRKLLEEGKMYDVIGIAETGWHEKIQIREGGWICMGRGRKVGEKKGGGVGMLIKEKEGRQIMEVILHEDLEHRFGYNKGDLITVKINEEKEEWLVTVVYMGVEEEENREDNKKMYETLQEISRLACNRKWVLMGDFNGHIGLNSDPVNKNGQMLLDFTETEGLEIKNWELEDPVTWKNRETESAIDYIIVNKKIGKDTCKVWKNEEIDISDHIMIGMTCSNARRMGVRRAKAQIKERWNLRDADWDRYREEIGQRLITETEQGERTIEQWEKDVKTVIEEGAKDTIGLKRFKVGTTRLKGWWDEEVKQAIENRKRENRKQREIRKLLKKYGEQHRESWEKAWNKYNKTKKVAQVLISQKISHWEARQARELNSLPRGQREKEGWKRIKRNLGGAVRDQKVTLSIGDRLTDKEDEIKKIIKDFWGKIIQADEKEIIENPVIFSDRKEMEEVKIERSNVQPRQREEKDVKR